MKFLLWFVSAACAEICKKVDLDVVDFCSEIFIKSGQSATTASWRDQKLISKQLEQYASLDGMDCDNMDKQEVKMFLCFYYLPYCHESGALESVPPCRQWCRNFKDSCWRRFTQYVPKWPSELECDKLPEDSQNSKGFQCIKNPVQKDPSDSYRELSSLSTAAYENDHCVEELKCPPEFQVRSTDGPSKYNFLGLGNCSAPCQDHFWSKKDIELAKKWILAWSVLCLISTLFTVLTYVIDKERFKYPERPIVFLAACYLIVSIVYITGYFNDNDVACTSNNPYENPNDRLFSKHPTLIVVQGTKNQSCTILFMILYFSTMASCIWWLVLCVNWFLAAVLKWSGEAIEAQAQYFHLVAWAVPAIATMSVLALGRIEGDPLSGICYTGQYDTTSLQIFILWPQLIFLCIGFIFLIIGFLSMYRIRAVVKNEHPGKHEGLEKLMLKIGIFSSIYLIPGSILLGCYFYEYMYNDIWNKSWLNKYCNYENDSPYGFTCSCDIKKEVEAVGHREPNFTFFMLRYFMMLIVGLSCGFWIWGEKTIASWKQFLSCTSSTAAHADPMAVPLRASMRTENSYNPHSNQMNAPNRAPSQRYYPPHQQGY
ncbi:Oidioi.mRNA.OKI2018_I69.XSR.g14463.t1.cds [Oikopleura dioica]|uniref:Oidioi.mRNA.OKI2018_I69.XSR.g14463.t1.cds n=1 Tax=Oikopleura dioica TaxID=34765 RepID=A0ABN7SES9_OIKDI|nr:Oidioi.mRNA.OKI2018_I69.XSR.g14463.t1.cds [Oikopleura dioica]